MTDVNGTLKAQTVSGAFVRGGRRTLPVLMIAELALTLVLTIGAGLLSRSFLQMVAVSNGFNSAGLTSFLPLAQASLVATFQVEDHPPVDPGKMPYVYLNHVSQDYFRTIGMQVRAGRPFSALDGSKSQRVAIIYVL